MASTHGLSDTPLNRGTDTALNGIVKHTPSALFGPGTAPHEREIIAQAAQLARVQPGEPGAKMGIAPGRCRNARDLRTQYIEMRGSPDGVDLEPLTVPKCVECSHCGWPVYCREAKVATKKTFLRAGMDRDGKRSEAKNNNQDDDEADSQDSRDTETRLQDELEELQDKFRDLEEEKEVLEEELKDEKEAHNELKEEHAQALETIEKLEEAEQRWRDKNSKLRMEKDRLLLYIDRLAMRREHIECDLKLYIQECMDLRKKLQVFMRRRGLMMDNMDIEFKRRDETNVQQLVMQMWGKQALADKKERELENLEARRQREVFGLQETNIGLWEHKMQLEAYVAKLKRRMKDAALRHLQRCGGTNHFPFAQAHAFTAWCGATPVFYNENRLVNAMQDLGETKEELCANRKAVNILNRDLTTMTADRDRLLGVEKDLNDKIDAMQESLDGAAGDLADAMVKVRKEMEEKMKHEAHLNELKMQKLLDEFEDEKETLNATIKSLERRLAFAEGLAAGGAGGQGKAAEDNRVVPHGQGVLCTGCLTQLVHRSVKALPPLAAVNEAKKGKPSARLDKAKDAFFAKELGGALNADDPIHKEMFMAQKDPYGLAMLSVWPEGAKPQKPNKWPPGDAAERMKSKSTPTMRETFTRDFKPRAFR